jgi:hypothetical protein
MTAFEYETSFTFGLWYFSFAYIFYGSLISLRGKDKGFSYFLFLRCGFGLVLYLHLTDFLPATNFSDVKNDGFFL